MGEAGSHEFVNRTRCLLMHGIYCWSRRVVLAILVGLFLTSYRAAFAQDFGELDRPSWDNSDSPAEYELGGALFPDILEPDGAANAPSGSAPGDFVESVADVPSSFSGASNNGTFSNGSVGSNGDPGGVPGLGRGPFSALGNAFQGGNGSLMNTVLQGLAFFSMLQDLLASFSSAGAQFNASNTGRSAFMAASNLLGILPGTGSSMLPFGGINSFTNAAAQRLGESTLGVPGTESGNLACAWVVNDIFRSVTGNTIVGPNGNPLSVYDTVRAMEGNPQMFVEVTREQAIASGRDYVSAWNPAWGGSASHIVYGRGDQGIGNSSGSRSIGTQGIGGQHARYFIINQ